jgi:hypothetical protein
MVFGYLINNFIYILYFKGLMITSNSIRVLVSYNKKIWGILYLSGEMQEMWNVWDEIVKCLVLM